MMLKRRRFISIKTEIMKKNYLSFIATFIVVFALNAQETIFSTDFSSADYTTGDPQTNLDFHPDWKAGHFSSSSTWTAFTTANPKDVIRTGSFFTYAIIDSKPIKAVVGDVITITVSLDLGFNGQSYGTSPDENLCFIGLLDKNNPTSGAEANVRDGVMISNKGITNELALTNNNQGNGSQFDATSGILANELNARTYEIIIEYTVGADAASSSKVAQISSVLGEEGSSKTTISTGLNPAVYTALTGSGAYFINWALRFGFGTSEINMLQMNSITIAKNMSLLSTSKVEGKSLFSMYPNPVKEQLYVNSTRNIEKVEIIDLLGKTILTTNKVDDYIDVSALTNAVYVLRLTSDKGTSTKKFVKN